VSATEKCLSEERCLRYSYSANQSNIMRTKAAVLASAQRGRRQEVCSFNKSKMRCSYGMR
jgi:hypothetical protein